MEHVWNAARRTGVNGASSAGHRCIPADAKAPHDGAARLTSPAQSASKAPVNDAGGLRGLRCLRSATVSLHFEVVFSLFLREDTPDDVMHELRYHLGLSTQRPANLEIDYGHPVLEPNPDSYLPGGEQAVLRKQYRYHRAGVEHHAWGLHVRLHWVDDAWGELWWFVASWLAPFVEDNGYAGFYREDRDERPTALIVLDGEPHVGVAGEESVPLND